MIYILQFFSTVFNLKFIYDNVLINMRYFDVLPVLTFINTYKTRTIRKTHNLKFAIC